jgi:carbonic anhydrase
VPPELIFDAVLGELFVVRVAGNVLSPEVAGSLQYAGAHLQTPLFVVFGHEGCGAVQAALQGRLLGVQHRSRIQILIDGIVPAIEGVDASLPPQQQLAWAVEANVRWQMRVIRDSPEGRARAAAGDFRLVGAIYDLGSGRVRWLEAE